MSDQPTNSAIVTLNLDDVRSHTAIQNDYAVAKYKNDYAGWAQNKPLLEAAGQPDPPAPTPPEIRLFDANVFATVFNAFVTRLLGEAALGHAGGEFDYSSAFTATAYPAITPPAPKPEPGQPDNPVGASLGGGYYGQAEGDKHGDGFVFTNPLGVKFRKYVVPTLVGLPSVWYQVVA